MGIVSCLVVYFVTWWTVLFVVLPFGVRQPDAPQEGVVGAPVAPDLKRKFLITSVLAAVIWGIIEAMFLLDVIDFRAMGDSVTLW